MSVTSDTPRLEGVALAAWRSYLQSHAAILRELDAELIAEHNMTTRDYEVLLYLAQSQDRQLPMSALAERTMLTRSGITRLVDGLVGCGLIERVSCDHDARISYAHLTDEGYEKLRRAGRTHIASVERLFLAQFSTQEVEQLATLLNRLPGSRGGGECTVSKDDSACAVADDSAAGACALSDEAAACAVSEGAAASAARADGCSIS